MLKQWVRAHPNLLALLFGCIAALLMLAVAEAVAGVLMRSRAGAWHEQWRYEYEPTQLSVPHQTMGLAALPNAEIRSRRISGDLVAYDVTYHTDAHRRRVTPAPGPETRTKTALFFGCSFTLGDGVEDEETLPAQFGVHSPGYRPYNLGYYGYGPQNTWLQLQGSEFLEGIEGPVDLVVYTLIPHHIDRAIGRMRTATTWGKTLPCVTSSRGGLRHHGTFEESGLVRQRLYTLLASSQLLRYLKLDLPVRLTGAHYRFTAQLLRECQDLAHSLYPQARFVVVLYPRMQSYAPMREALEAQGVPYAVLDPYLPGDFVEAPEYLLPDRHPSPAAYRAVAAALAQWLDAAGSSRETTPNIVPGQT